MSLASHLAKLRPWWEPEAALQRSMDEGARNLRAARAALDRHRQTVDEANHVLADTLRQIGGLTTSEHAHVLACIEGGCDTGVVREADPIVNLIYSLERQAEGECCDE